MNTLLSAFKISCRKKKLRITEQRQEIFLALAQADSHPTAEALHQLLQKRLPSLSLDTVYRTLATLTEHGLVRRLVTAEGPARFDVALTPHHHLVCQRCNRVVDFQWSAFDASALPPLPESWISVDNRVVTLHGLCATCHRTVEQKSENEES